MNRTLLTLIALAAGALLIPDMAEAQRGRGGGFSGASPRMSGGGFGEAPGCTFLGVAVVSAAARLQPGPALGAFARRRLVVPALVDTESAPLITAATTAEAIRTMAGIIGVIPTMAGHWPLA
ncbi:hypothetical protein AA309_25305 [Microvirga vignae]|uniref:Uncharacterized protein n=1 Tax=Microvirga vignae TaxID=1225564 RepID=A0A0H1RD57_9HYPH|nr:hypothetical protein AA309_25305 [Microvirga vignae]